MFLVYSLAFKNAYVPIQIFSFYFRPAGAKTASGKTIRPKYKLGAMAVSAGRWGRQRTHLKVAVDRAVHRLEAEISRQAADKIQVDIAVDGGEVGLLAWVLAERDLYWPIHGFGHSGARYILHLNTAVHVVHGKVSGHVLHPDMP